MPTAEQLQCLFDFENVFDAAIRDVFDKQNFNTLVRADVSDFQEERPRLEIIFKVGQGAAIGAQGATKVLPNIFVQDGIPTVPMLAVCAAYRCTVHFALVTNGTEDDKKAHAAYLFQARWIIATLAPRVNFQRLKLHTLHSPVIPGDTTTFFQKEKGYWVSSFSAEATFTVRDQAWAVLTS